jgi:hypothetical protein
VRTENIKKISPMNEYFLKEWEKYFSRKEIFTDHQENFPLFTNEGIFSHWVVKIH